MPSSAQTVALATVFDYEYYAGDPTAANMPPAVNERIRLTLFTNQGEVTSPAVGVVPRSVVVTTDANGYWTAQLLPTSSGMTPTGSYWLVETPSRTFPITFGSGGGQASALVASV